MHVLVLMYVLAFTMFSLLHYAWFDFRYRFLRICSVLACSTILVIAVIARRIAIFLVLIDVGIACAKYT